MKQSQIVLKINKEDIEHGVKLKNVHKTSKGKSETNQKEKMSLSAYGHMQKIKTTTYFRCAVI